jgi:hypothetical protein
MYDPRTSGIKRTGTEKRRDITFGAVSYGDETLPYRTADRSAAGLSGAAPRNLWPVVQLWRRVALGPHIPAL